MSRFKDIWKGWIQMADQNPIVGLSVLIGFVSAAGVAIVPPIRGHLGYNTEQWTKVAPDQPWRKEVQKWPPSYDRTV